jgi:hypothetical protein
MPRTYKIRRFQNGRSAKGDPFYNYSLTVPSPLAEQLPNDIHYGCELLPEVTLPDDESIPADLRGRTIKGILFEPEDFRPNAVELPEWARKSENGETPPKPQRSRRRPGASAPA